MTRLPIIKGFIGHFRESEKKMRKLTPILILFVLAMPDLALTTAQHPDYLVYQGETFPMFSNPLESFFDEKNPRPNHLFPFGSTACWRGYIATWKIEDRQLYLVKLKDCSPPSEAQEIPLSGVFPGRKGPIKADWYSGTLRIPQGKQLLYVHMGYGSVYEKELFLTIERGKVVREQVIDNTRKNLPTEEKQAWEELLKLKEWEDSIRPNAASAEGSGSIQREKSSSRIEKLNGFFQCEVPVDWTVWPDDQRGSERTRVFGIVVQGPSRKDELPTSISLRYYSEDNAFFPDAQAYLKRQQAPGLIHLKGEKTGPPEPFTLGKSSGFRFLRDTFEYFPPDSLDTKEISVRKEYVVLTYEKGFFVLVYSATRTGFESYRSSFQHVLDTFKPLHLVGEPSDAGDKMDEKPKRESFPPEKWEKPKDFEKGEGVPQEIKDYIEQRFRKKGEQK